MQISSPIFGAIEINEPVLVDLINSKPLQRLKGIHSGGPCQFIHKNLTGETRFVHCVGTMLILRHFNASLLEQIAGLLHDVSHTAFSHCIDYVFSDGHSQNFQDTVLAEFILNTEIPGILRRHNIAVNAVLDPRQFPLLEQEIPDLCADRLDYSLRHLLMPPHLAPLRPPDVLQHVMVHQGKLIMNSPVVAWKYARAFLQWYQKELADIRCIAAFQILADAIKRALGKGILTKADLFGDDVYVMGKLKKSGDPHILQLISVLTPEFNCVIDKVHPDLTSGAKNRYIDPLVRVGSGALKRVSEIYPDFAKELAEQKALLDHQEFPIRIVSSEARVPTAGLV